MKLHIKCLLLFSFVYYSFDASAQKVNMYVQIKDKGIRESIYAEKHQLKDSVRSSNNKLEKVLKQYKPIKFHKAFPTAKTPMLQEVYYVESESEELGRELMSRFSMEEIPKVEFINEAEITGDYYSPNDFASNQKALELIDVKYAYDYFKDFDKEPVAVIDTYFDTSHEDLSFTTIRGSNSSNNFHGTAVAGLITAITDNNKGIASIGYNSPLLGSSTMTDNEVLVVAQMGYRVINCSWYNRCSFNSIQDALYKEIRDTCGTLVVFGAGNGTNHCGSLSAKIYPASYESVISVTSVGQNIGGNADCHEDIVGDSTSTHHHNDAVDICAPGYNVRSTDITGSSGAYSGNYGNFWGTSFAAPQVTGTLGIIYTINPCLTADEAVDILLNSVDTTLYSKSENSAYIGKLGNGRLDVAKAAEAAAISATIEIDGETYSTTELIESNYGINVSNTSLTSSADIEIIARKDITLDSDFEAVVGSELLIDIDPTNLVSCN